MIIGVCGFSWSGSGAVIDYLMEFDTLQVYPPEFILAYHPDGLHDLDVNLNENCAKFLSSGVAIPRFRKTALSLLNGPTHGMAKQLTEEYLDKLIQAKWIGLEQGHSLVCKHSWLYRQVGLRIRNRIIPKLSPEFCWKHKPYPLAEMEYSICPEHFLEQTQNYVLGILETIGLDTQKDIVLNQPFPGNNPVPYMQYYKDAKAVVVDRDPRDVFVFLKYVFPGHSYSVPLENVNVFCEYYEHMHKNLNTTLDHPDVLYLQFEDLIYHYDESTGQIQQFLKLAAPEHARQYFQPEQSEANTQVFLKYGKSDEISVIEKKLGKYLYDFSRVKKQSNSDGVFDDNPKSAGYCYKRG